MRSLAVVLALALALPLVGDAGAVTFDPAPSSCATSGFNSTCQFACDLGDVILILVDAQNAASYVSAQAECGSATAACAGTGGCAQVSTRSSANSWGTCTSASVATTTCVAWMSPLGVASTAGPTCTAAGEGSSCYYVCVAGKQVYASASGPSLFTSAATTCGGASAVCTGSSVCYQRSLFPVGNLVAIGACRAFSGSTTATCGMVV